MEIDFIIKNLGDTSLDQPNGSVYTPQKLLEIKDLTLLTPRSGQTLISHLDMEIKDKDHLLVRELLVFVCQVDFDFDFDCLL